MRRQAKTQRIIDHAHEILDAYRPMTVRQVFYQLVSRQDVENTRSRYQSVGRALVNARREGLIPWEWIEDHLRHPRGRFTGWRSVERYLDDAIDALGNQYYAAVWPIQPRYVEVWLEKDELAGIFSAALAPYHTALNVGRGYDGWSSVHNAAGRFRAAQQEESVILYFGDFDPSGEDMARSLEERLNDQGASLHILKVALTEDDIERYHLPPNRTKPTDSRARKHIAKHGDVSVELDALPPAVLRDSVVEAVEATLNMGALAVVREQEARGRAWLANEIAAIKRRRDEDAREGGAS
jgi:hypothetical protein